MTRLPDSCTVALSYDANTSTTYAFYRGPLEQSERCQLTNMLTCLLPCLESPMLLPILITELRYEPGEINTDREYRTILNIEPQTGYHPFGDIDEDGGDDQQVRNSVHNIKALQRATLLTAMVEIRQKAFLLVLDGVDAELALEGAAAAALELGRHARVLRAQMRNNLLRAEHLQKRCSTQLTVLYNLGAQQDLGLSLQLTRDSRNIAAAAKADSTAMRSVAFAAKRDSSAMKSVAW